MEIWKDIKGYEGYYQVSSEGRVKSLKRVIVRSDGGGRVYRERIMRTPPDNHGYLVVNLGRGCEHKKFKVHQLVAITFLNHTPNGMKIICDHINNIKTDNRVENLQLISSRENASKDRKDGSSRFTGVYRRLDMQKWEAKIEINGKTIYLGSFAHELDAANEYRNMLEVVNTKSDSDIKKYIIDNYKPTFTSKHKGVSWCRNTNKWKAQIALNNKRMYLGCFLDELEAAEAYQNALKELS